MNWIPVKLVSVPGGTVLANPNGRIRSLNPSTNTPPYGPYVWQERDPGTAGGYERCSINGSTVVYSPVAADIFVYGFQETHPTMTGFSAMTEEPL